MADQEYSLSMVHYMPLIQRMKKPKTTSTPFYIFWNKESFANVGISSHWEEFNEIIMCQHIDEMFYIALVCPIEMTHYSHRNLTSLFFQFVSVV